MVHLSHGDSQTADQSSKHLLTIFVSKPRDSDSPHATKHKGLSGRAVAQPKVFSPEALLSSAHLRCVVLGENKAVHMSHGHHVQDRAPGVAQGTSDQCPEVESQKVQVVLRRGSVLLQRHRKLQQTHSQATLPFCCQSKVHGFRVPFPSCLCALSRLMTCFQHLTSQSRFKK